ncbi:unnamed protein product [Camellia sinensis]
MQGQGSMEDPMVVDADESKKMNSNLESFFFFFTVYTLTTEDREARVNALRVEVERFE